MTNRFPQWFRDALAERGMKPAEFARISGIPHSTISTWLSGGRKPNAASVRKVARALGLDEDAALVAAGHKSPDRFRDPDSPAAKLIALVERVDWDRHPDVFRGLQAQLREYVESDRKAKEQEAVSESEGHE